MKAIQANRWRLLCLIAVALVATLMAIGCAPTDDPFDVGDRAAAKATAEAAALSPRSGPTPTPLPTLSPEEAAVRLKTAGEAHLASLFEDTAGIVKLGNWDDKKVQLENTLVGYIMVYGYDYAVELVDTPDESYKESLPKGEVDVVMEMAPGWWKEHAEAGLIVDVGTTREHDPDIRIGVYGAIRQNAPELVEFLGKYAPGEERIAELASLITGGRTGIKPTAAARCT